MTLDILYIMCKDRQRRRCQLMSDLLFAVTQHRVLAGGCRKLPTGTQALFFCASCVHCALPPHCCPVTGFLRGSPGRAQRSRPNSRSQKGAWQRKVGRSRKPGACDGAAPKRRSLLDKQHDVCYRDRYLRVPTRTAAQLGLYVSARRAGRRVWCIQSRVGRLSSGREHLQAQRSWSELQLSQQLLPSQGRGRV